MKKLIALLLALVMCLSLCACGNDAEESRPLTKEELYAQKAVTVAMLTIDKDRSANQALAKQKYCEKNLSVVRCYVEEITSDHVILSSLGNFYIRAYVPTDDLIRLERGQFVNVIGISSADFELAEEPSGEFIWTHPYLDLTNAYITDILDD